MMYASLSAYMKDKKNSVTLYSRPPIKSPSLSVNRTLPAVKVKPKSLSMSHIMEAAGDGLGDEAGLLTETESKQSLEDEIRRMDEKQGEGSSLSVLSVEQTGAADSMLVKLLNYLKDHKVGIVKIQKERGNEKGSDPGAVTPAADETSDEASDKSREELTEVAEEIEEGGIIFKPPPPYAEKNDDKEVPVEPQQQTASSEGRHHKMSRYEVFVNLEEDGKRLNELLLQIEKQVGGVRYRRPKTKPKKNFDTKSKDNNEVLVSPGFPMRINEMDVISKHVLMYGAELDAEHPGFKDPEYRKRRLEFGQIAFHYRHGQPLPRVEYNETEKQTWAVVFRELMRLYPNYACTEFLHNMQILQQDCGYSENDIPQLPDVSKFLKARSGFQLRPVAGYLSPRDFLAGLAFRVFHTTQYIRHPSEPFYSPEPDCCHELLGHVPMLADPEFAQFSQEIGLASLGASEEDIKKLAILYFFTMEFGLCRDAPPPPKTPVARTVSLGSEITSDDEQGPLRVYGAGLLSCVAELKHVLSGEANIRKFDPTEAIKTECMVTTFQETYFFNDSFLEAVEDVRLFAEAVKKPFTVRYNPYTEALEIIDNVRRVERLISELRQDATILSSALRRLGYEGSLRFIKSDKTVENLP